MMATRRLAKPIFVIKKNVEPAPQPKIIDEPMDIVIIDDQSDESIDEIELNFKGNIDVFLDPTAFWEKLDSLKWKDFSELPQPHNRWGQKQNKPLQFDEYSVASVTSFKKHFWKYLNDLREVFTEKGVFSSFERELNEYEQTQLLSHIVAKGQIYYATILSEPYFCGALVSKDKTKDEFEDFVKHIK
jgi:hypothetical protein